MTTTPPEKIVLLAPREGPTLPEEPWRLVVLSDPSGVSRRVVRYRGVKVWKIAADNDLAGAQALAAGVLGSELVWYPEPGAWQAERRYRPKAAA